MSLRRHDRATVPAAGLGRMPCGPYHSSIGSASHLSFLCGHRFAFRTEFPGTQQNQQKTREEDRTCSLSVRPSHSQAAGSQQGGSRGRVLRRQKMRCRARQPGFRSTRFRLTQGPCHFDSDTGQATINFRRPPSMKRPLVAFQWPACDPASCVFAIPHSLYLDGLFGTF